MINSCMDYSKHYDRLIERAKTRQLEGYVERHHVVPRCMGGTDERSNLVELTPEEHYVAHQLLVKIYPDNDALVYAANMMTVGRNNKRYGWLKRRYQSACKRRTGDKNPSFGRSWYHCPTTLANGKFLPNEIPQDWIKGRTPKRVKKCSTVTVKKCSKCGQSTCSRPLVCRNGQRLKRFINNFGFDSSCIGNDSFYNEHDRIVQKLREEYLYQKLSVEELRIKYNMKLNETVRCLLRSLEIGRRDLSSAVKNIHRRAKVADGSPKP